MDIPLFQVLGFSLGMCKQASVLETCVQYGSNKGRQVGSRSKKKQRGACTTWHQYLRNLHPQWGQSQQYKFGMVLHPYLLYAKLKNNV